jgi:uncharacterized protein YndB with AHSA1/START domain
MEKIRNSILIAAPKEKVWSTMLDDATYKEWTSEFNPTANSYYEGSWTTGNDMRFLGLEKDGTVSGMISRIKEVRPYEFVSIQHLGEISHGTETRYPSENQMLENYTFSEKNGATEVLVEMDTIEKYKDMFSEMWPKALEKLKQIAER